MKYAVARLSRYPQALLPLFLPQTYDIRLEGSRRTRDENIAFFRQLALMYGRRVRQTEPYTLSVVKTK